ncbi:L-histidine N(alpha)-methyltransferase [Pelagibaculum spongiae]|nr:L-histidine N(alpha)-methyltransferase [Pelagibaculum spongiae]
MNKSNQKLMTENLQPNLQQHTADFQFHDFAPKSEDLSQAIQSGWSEKPKNISPKFFYDQRGSQLFDKICQLDEYYVTRTEIMLLEKHANEIAKNIGDNSCLIEMGSGSSKKIRLILEALRPALYMPIDISREHLIESASLLAKDYSWLKINAVCLDYSEQWNLPDETPRLNRAAFFPGSSIGNFHPLQASQLLQQMSQALGKGGKIIIGVDLKKPEKQLNAAYNDKNGITAEFNKNLLHRINRELFCDINPDSFSHNAFYSHSHNRIEMHLVSNQQQVISIQGIDYHFDKGESIHTECSYKYSASDFQQLAVNSGLTPLKCWIDNEAKFSIHLLEY